MFGIQCCDQFGTFRDRGAIPGYVWVSTDDGDTWVDETADLVTMAVLSGQWYEGTWYLNTAGSGILSKELEPQE